MTTIEEILEYLEESKKIRNARRKHFDDISCEDALRMVKERQKKIKNGKIKEGTPRKAAKKGYEVWDLTFDQGKDKNRKVSVQVKKGGSEKDAIEIAKKTFKNLSNIKAKKAKG